MSCPLRSSVQTTTFTKDNEQKNNMNVYYPAAKPAAPSTRFDENIDSEIRAIFSTHCTTTENDVLRNAFSRTPGPKKEIAPTRAVWDQQAFLQNLQFGQSGSQSPDLNSIIRQAIASPNVERFNRTVDDYLSFYPSGGYEMNMNVNESSPRLDDRFLANVSHQAKIETTLHADPRSGVSKLGAVFHHSDTRSGVTNLGAAFRQADNRSRVPSLVDNSALLPSKLSIDVETTNVVRAQFPRSTSSRQASRYASTESEEFDAYAGRECVDTFSQSSEQGSNEGNSRSSSLHLHTNRSDLFFDGGVDNFNREQFVPKPSPDVITHPAKGSSGQRQNSLPYPVFSEPIYRKSRDDKLSQSTESNSIHTQFLASSGNRAPAENAESPRSKQAFKEFMAFFRTRWQASPLEAELYALETVDTLPEHVRWRVFVELAELAKKMDDSSKARKYYRLACEYERQASTIWLEWSKMEEENGCPEAALQVLILGLVACPVRESLLPRIVKLFERLRKFDDIRMILSVLKYEKLDRTWKLLLEGGLFEARDGRNETSRRIFKFLMKHVHWHGPIYYEAFRLEERIGYEEVAISIAETGLSELKHYGPLWFGLMRLLERRDVRDERQWWLRGYLPSLATLTEMCHNAIFKISKELTWRVHFERFQAEERAVSIAARGLYYVTNGVSLRSCREELVARCRRSLAQSLLFCPTTPNNLRWRLFLVGARMEASVDNIEVARTLLKRAYDEVPGKAKATVIIECSRLEEFVGNVDLARKILCLARAEMCHDWKGYFERISLEVRAGKLSQALVIAKEAVCVHQGTGRLWAFYIQLCHKVEACLNQSGVSCQVEPKETLIRRAIAEVPKSGEVWCEFGRCLLNPFQVDHFDLKSAMRALKFAITFTPQYGDSFIEYLRVEILCDFLLSKVCNAVGLNFNAFGWTYVMADEDSDLNCTVQDPSLAQLSGENDYSHEKLVQTIEAIRRMQFDFGELNLTRDYPHLMRRCGNADPNYGSAWFHCRLMPYDLPMTVLQNAKELVFHELVESHRIYARAMLYYIERCLSSAANISRGPSEMAFLSAWQGAAEEDIDSKLFVDRSSVFCSEDFVTGLICMNRSTRSDLLSRKAHWRQLFGSDHIIN